jgi:purine catabolism regulator
VRWVHVSDSAGVARLLDGGELLLSTGQGWPADPAELGAFIGRLAAAGLACLVLELGTHYRYVPAVVIDAARAQGLALVALHNEVKFVQLTEAVHRRIIADQSAALQAATRCVRASPRSHCAGHPPTSSCTSLRRRSGRR